MEGVLMTTVRLRMHQWLAEQAALLVSTDPIYGLGVNVDVAAMEGENSDKQFGVTLGKNRARKLPDRDGVLIDKDGQQEFLVYARVTTKDKTTRSTQYETVQALIAWLEKILEDDPGMGGVTCPNVQFGEWDTPTRGDALDSQPYVLAMSFLAYEEP
jgi:hypothetical protein